MKTILHSIPGLAVTDHVLRVPLDHGNPDAESIDLFAREVVDADRVSSDMPCLLFLQGGPGFPAPRPFGPGSWVGTMAKQFRVILLDQRGTGRSTPIDGQCLKERGGAAQQAQFLAHFRMDSIVSDAELLRVALMGKSGQWTLLGQSFGGFCATHYLSVAPESLREVLITGGLPGLETPIDDIYRLTYQRMLEKNEEYYERYPGDVQRIRALAEHLQEHEVHLPDGTHFSVAHLQALGQPFGMSDGFEQVHYLIEGAFPGGTDAPRLGYGFLRSVENFLHFDTNPIYALLHEMCYTQGFASNWSAERVLVDFPAFVPSSDRPVYLVGEMIRPSLFADVAALKPLAQTAEELAQKQDWPRLYDPRKLAQNKVPVAAAVYYSDAYVPRELSMQTAQAMGNTKAWVTNEYEHNGLRADGPRIVQRLLDMARGAE